MYHIVLECYEKDALVPALLLPVIAYMTPHIHVSEMSLCKLPSSVFLTGEGSRGETLPPQHLPTIVWLSWASYSFTCYGVVHIELRHI